MSRRRFNQDLTLRDRLLDKALLNSLTSQRTVELRPFVEEPSPNVNKFERAFNEILESIQDVVTEPLVLASLVFASFIFLSSEEDYVIAYIVDFLGSYGVSGKLTKYVPRLLHYLFSIVPLFSLMGNRRWLALALSAAICFVLRTEVFLVYSVLGVSVRLIFGAGTLQTGALLMFAVLGLLVVLSPSPQNYVSRGKRSAEGPLFPLIPSEETNDTLIPT